MDCGAEKKRTVRILPIEKEAWSGGQDLNLRRTGFCFNRPYPSGCVLDRLGDAHCVSRRLQRLHHARL